MLKFFFTLTVAIASLSLLGQKQDPNKENPNPVIGEWEIDLRPIPNSHEYLITFEIIQVEGKVFQGTYFGSEIANGVINDLWDSPVLSFTTADENHTYYHSAKIMGKTMEGITYCPDITYTAPWKGSLKD